MSSIILRSSIVSRSWRVSMSKFSDKCRDSSSIDCSPKSPTVCRPAKKGSQQTENPCLWRYRRYEGKHKNEYLFLKYWQKYLGICNPDADRRLSVDWIQFPQTKPFQREVNLCTFVIWENVHFEIIKIIQIQSSCIILWKSDTLKAVHLLRDFIQILIWNIQ